MYIWLLFTAHCAVKPRYGTITDISPIAAGDFAWFGSKWSPFFDLRDRAKGQEARMNWSSEYTGRKGDLHDFYHQFYIFIISGSYFPEP